MQRRYSRKIFTTVICFVFLFQCFSVKTILAESLEKEIEVDLEVLSQGLPIFEKEEELFQEDEEAMSNPPVLEIAHVEKNDGLVQKNETVVMKEESQVSKESDIEEINEEASSSGTFGTTPWEFDEETGVLNIGEEFIGSITSFPGNGNRPSWEGLKDRIRKIIFLSEVIGGKNIEYTFADHVNVVSIENINLLNVSETEDMRSLFENMKSLKTLDLNSWDTSSVTSMYAMFYNTTALTTLDVNYWDTSNVTNMSNMFNRSLSLTTLDIIDWDTSKVIRMASMFREASSLITLNLDSWDTGNVTDMSYTFSGLSALTTLDVSEWDTSKVTTMFYTFARLGSLKSLNLSTWVTGNVTNMSGMFQSSSSLTEINKGMWDTSNVTQMVSVFASMKAIKELDLKEWDTSNVTSITGMFANMTSLEKLDISGFDTQNVTTKNALFFGNSNLRSLSIGNEFIFQSTAGLPDITATDYSGCWVGESTGTVFESSAEFMANKKLGEADTYTWEKVVIEIKIPVNMLFHSTRTDSTIVSSPNYSITNNSNVSMDVLIFQTESTNLNELESLSLNEVKLVENGISVLSEKTKLMTLEKSEINQMLFSGEVKSSLANEVNPSFNLTFKFLISRH